MDEQIIIAGEFKYVDPTTGEVWHLTWASPDEAKAAWEQLTALQKNTDRAVKTIKKQFEDYLSQTDREDMHFNDGETVRRVGRATRKYSKLILREYLNEDEMDLVTAPVNTLVKDMILDKTNRGELEPGAFRQIEDTADISYSYSMQIVKTNRSTK